MIILGLTGSIGMGQSGAARALRRLGAAGVDADGAVRVIVLAGAGGKAFSAGADISEFAKMRQSEDAIEAYAQAVTDATRALVETRKPLIARIDGSCIGGGLGVAICCDLRIAAEDSRFAIPAAKLGLG